MKKIEYTKEQIATVIEKYQSQLSVQTIVTETGINKGSIRAMLQEAGVLRTKNEAQRICRGVKSLRSDAFDILTPEALYWIGFLYADGHMEKSTFVITLTTSGKDKQHLEKFNTFLGGELNIRNVTQKAAKPAPGQVNFEYEYFRIGFSDPKIYNRLKELGFTHNKTLFIEPHPLLKYSRDFWRGVVDGDGWLCYNGDTRAEGKYSYPCIGLSGTEITIIEWFNFLRLNGLITETKPHKRKGNVWETNLHNKPTLKACEILYKDSTIYLDRKYNKYLEFLKDNN